MNPLQAVIQTMRRIRSRPALAVSIAFAVLVLCGTGFLLKSPPALAAVDDPAARESLPVAAVGRRDIRQQIEVPGEFRPYQEVDVDAKVRGYVSKLHVDIGDTVKKGQVLAELEIPELSDDLRSADAAVNVARQQAERARAQHDDDQAIYQRLLGVMHERPELIAQQDIDQARAKADGSLAAQTAAEAAIKQATAEQTRVRDTEAYSKIYAPFDGVITARLRDEGSLVGAASSGNAIFHISEMNRLRLVLEVPESTVPDVAVGNTAKVTVSALQSSFDLPVSRISHQLAESTRTMHVEIDFDNAKDLVAPGMYAQVELPLKVRTQVLAIPLSALHDHAEGSDTGKIYVLDQGGQVQARQVGVGLAGPNHVEIKTGLDAGELVVVDVTPRLEKGVRYVAKLVSEDVNKG
ncbi:MAG: efflux transporter periplasmic adaptor subunit [Nevskia sp.]|nr:efflux transporter periplasmic adaptor subunit [Nevskia sp.]